MSAKQTLPLDESAEAALLQGCLQNADVYPEVARIITGSDFGVPKFGLIWDALGVCFSENKPFDKIVILDILKKQGHGPELLTVLEDLQATAVELDLAESWAEIVKDKSLLRRLYGLAANVASEVRKDVSDGQTILELAETGIYQLTSQTTTDQKTFAEQLDIVLKHIVDAKPGDRRGISTGIKELDVLTGGLQGGQFWIVAARPGMGKSALGMQLAVASAKQGVASYWSTLEMGHEENILRLVAGESGIDSRSLLTGTMTPEQMTIVRKTVAAMQELPLIIDDNPPTTIDLFRSHVRKLNRTKKIGWVGVDYIQLMYGARKRNTDNKEQEVSEISRGLKTLARELKIPVVGLSQLSRGLENRADKRPQLSDLRQSGALEQDADNVVFLYRDSVYNAASPGWRAEIIIAKQRSGPLGTVHMVWDANSVRYLEKGHPRARELEAIRPQGRI